MAGPDKRTKLQTNLSGTKMSFSHSSEDAAILPLRRRSSVLRYLAQHFDLLLPRMSTKEIHIISTNKPIGLATKPSLRIRSEH
ncbi:unnamed protein product [Protopolystoma xenopodis]|uniref:Uncharacterized protein n=1 Tax=Protopolystoma xenopodis TaxID=117903 RepID=A0A3S5A9Q6_9PLAT|nr:unnamed protein product [Protopolystoma xenopodis]